MIAIIGAGISGLSCGLTLQEAGFSTVILAHRFSPNTTSDISAALWYPYKAEPKERVLRWGDTSVKKFRKLIGRPEAGVSVTEVLEVLPESEPEPWWKGSVRNFRRLPPNNLPLDYTQGYLFEVPLIEMPVYMKYLEERYFAGGGRLKKLSARFTSFNDISDRYSIIINCSGIGAAELANDSSVYPVRGQVVVTANPGISRCTLDIKGPRALTYIIPQGDVCILGGTAEENNWDVRSSEKTGEQILKSCCEFEPRLAEAKILDQKAGLRPARRGGVRLESESLTSGRTIIHNYGHGGGGVTVSWGCAIEVLELVKETNG